MQLHNLDATACQLLPFCGVKNPQHPGRCGKNAWLKKQFALGLRSKIVTTPDQRQCGLIEYIPGEYAWRGVDAKGYMFIHCIWTWLKAYQNRGLARMMIEACEQDAEGMKGVAVVTREKPWLAGPAVFLANGYRVVEKAAPDYQLLVKRFDTAASLPKFKGEWERKLERYGEGLTIVRSAQCPHIHKFASEIEQSAREEFGLDPQVVTIETYKDAQNAPTPYAVFAIIHDGRLLADHQISRTRFRNLMKKVH